MDYNGNRCILCNNEFSENDDIVVCPECGTPYHRACYKKEGKCINTVLHVKNESWKPEIRKNEENIEKSNADVIICSECGSENSASALFCENCGKPADKNDDKNDFYEGINESIDKKICDIMGISREAEMDGVKMYEMAYFVKINIPYYMSFFKKFSETGKKFSINLLCFFVPYYYFANRKMYMWALISFGIFTLFSIPQMISIMAGGELISSVYSSITQNVLFNAVLNTSNFMLLAFRVIMAIAANWLYCRHTIKSIKNIKSEYPVDKWANTMLQKGGTSFAAIIITMLIEFAVMFVMMIAISFFLLISSY